MQSLPQLETNTFSGQIFWLFITFLILYFFISKAFLPKIFNIIFERKNYFSFLQEKLFLIKEKIQKLKIANEDILKKTKIQAFKISQDCEIQKNEIKKRIYNKKKELLEKLSEQFSSEIKDNFDLNEINIFNKYIHINEVFSKKLLDSDKNFLNENNELILKANFEKNISNFKEKNF